MTEPYSTWDPELATPKQDNLPDTAIVPYIEKLRETERVETYQSCAGHKEGGYEWDGCLWFTCKEFEPHKASKNPIFTEVSRLYTSVPDGEGREVWRVQFKGMNKGREEFELAMRILFENMGVGLPE